MTQKLKITLKKSTIGSQKGQIEADEAEAEAQPLIEADEE